MNIFFMKPKVEYTGKNIDEAVQKACKKLKLTEDKLKYDIISHGSSGIFGIVGSKKARIKIVNNIEKRTLSTTKEESRAEVRSLIRETLGDEYLSEAERSERKKQHKSQVKSEKHERFENRAKTDHREKQNNRLRSEKQPRHDNRPKQHDPGNQAARSAQPAIPVHNKHDNQPNHPKVEPVEQTQTRPSIDVDDSLIELGKDALTRILNLITEDATIVVDKNSEDILFNIEGGDSAIIIGKHGQTLEAIQYLVDKIVNKKSDERVHFMIDVKGYVATRRSHLQKLANRLAEKAKRSGKPFTIGKMSSNERRVIHLYLKGDREVRTQSMGDGYYRKLVIFPKGNRRRSKQD